MNEDYLKSLIFNNVFLNQLKHEPFIIGSKKHFIVYDLNVKTREDNLIYLSLANLVIEHISNHKICNLFSSYTDREIQEFILEWAKPWRYWFLVNQITKNELELILRGNLVLQADTQHELENKYKEARVKLSLVSPPVDLTLSGSVDKKGHFININEIKDKLTNNQLEVIEEDCVEIDNVIVSKYGNAVVKDLSKIITDKFKELKQQNQNLHSLIKMYSGSRDVETQSTLGKLGYPAAKLSYHTLGKAVDIGLNQKGKELWRKYLEEKQSYQQIDELLQQNVNLTIENMIINGIIDVDFFIVELNSWFKTFNGIIVLDESPFFRTEHPSTKKTISLQPLWHLQLK